MGKSPGKWIKNFLLGKKSSKSSPKGRDVLKSSNKVEQVISSTKLPIPEPAISSPLVGVNACSDAGLENQVPSNTQTNEVVPAPLNGKEQGSVSSENTDKPNQDQAATTTQVDITCHSAGEGICDEKWIVMLQAQIRGYLVRRQAVSTLCCVKAIVRFQALVRGRKNAKISNPLDGDTIVKLRSLSKNTFVYKLRASLPSAISLRLQYGSEDPNSASIWLERWTKSRFWDPPCEPNKTPDSKSCKKSDSAKKTEPKKGSRRLSDSNGENGSLESEKVKRNPKKVSSNPVNTLNEHSPNEIEKVKRGLRKSSDSVREFFDRSSVENGKSKQKTKKVSSDSAEKPKDTSELGVVGDSVEKSKDIPEALPKQSDIEKDTDFPVTPGSPLDSHPIKILSRDNERRASLPAKFDPQESNGVYNTTPTPKLPSYMAPTESVKAKLRAQGSPRFNRDVAAEKNALLRRYSLSSSTNSLMSGLSPRAHKLVQANGRGLVRGDRSFSSSRDGDKMVQAEWRR